VLFALIFIVKCSSFSCVLYFRFFYRKKQQRLIIRVLQSGKEQRSEMTSPEPKVVPAVPPPCFRRDDNVAGMAGLPAGLSLLPSAAKTSISPAPAVDEHRQNATARFSAPMSPSGGPALNLHAQT
jgi:hypothetical protein